MSQGWTEADSQLYQDIAPIAVPARAEQLATLLTLLPFNQGDSFHAVELGSGEGLLSAALLACFPNATVTALDGSADMRAKAAANLAQFGGRARLAPFTLDAPDWHKFLQNTDCVLSSLVIHHLAGPAKRALFANIHTRLTQRGVLLIADLVQPQLPPARTLFAAGWDHAAKSQSLAQTGSTGLFDKFQQVKWNYYRFDDPADRPSPLFDQLLWLKEAGFAVVDCFWLQAGHAIYGGYKTADLTLTGALPFETALDIVRETLNKGQE